GFFSTSSLECQPRNLLCFRCLCHQTDSDQDNQTDDKQQHCKMQKVHSDIKVQKAVQLLAGIKDFQYESRCAEHETDQQRSNRALPVDSFPNNPQEKNRRNGRGNISLHALQINPEL